MTEGPGLDLGRRRDLGALLTDSLRLLGRHLPTFLMISAAVVIPVEGAVLGLGLEQLTSGYDKDSSTAELVIPVIVTFFVVTPLITATIIHALGRISKGERPRAFLSLQEGLETFTPLFLAVVIAATGIGLGLLLLFVPGIYLLVRWYFVPQAVAVEGKEKVAALERSSELAQGNWWRIFGTILLANLIAAVPGIIILTPLAEAAEAADSAGVALAGSMLADIVVTPFVALLSTLLYYDLRARREGLT